MFTLSLTRVSASSSSTLCSSFCKAGHNRAESREKLWLNAAGVPERFLSAECCASVLSFCHKVVVAKQGHEHMNIASTAC
jgi:hypothetical protein